MLLSEGGTIRNVHPITSIYVTLMLGQPPNLQSYILNSDRLKDFPSSNTLLPTCSFWDQSIVMIFVSPWHDFFGPQIYAFELQFGCNTSSSIKLLYYLPFLTSVLPNSSWADQRWYIYGSHFLSNTLESKRRSNSLIKTMIRFKINLHQSALSNHDPTTLFLTGLNTQIFYDFCRLRFLLYGLY